MTTQLRRLPILWWNNQKRKKNSIWWLRIVGDFRMCSSGVGACLWEIFGEITANVKLYLEIQFSLYFRPPFFIYTEITSCKSISSITIIFDSFYQFIP